MRWYPRWKADLWIPEEGNRATFLPMINDTGIDYSQWKDDSDDLLPDDMDFDEEDEELSDENSG